jgi:hypothetical protein
VRGKIIAGVLAVISRLVDAGRVTPSSGTRPADHAAAGAMMNWSWCPVSCERS